MTKVKVHLEREKKVKQVAFIGKNVLALLNHLKINPETVLVVRKGEVITENEVLKDADEVEILSVISGG